MSQATQPSPAEIYDSYLVPGMFDRWAPVLIDAAAPRPGGHALDFGCGTGIVARHLAPRLAADGRITGLDPNPDMLAVARARPAPEGADTTWQEGIADDLPADTFDLALAQQSLQFCPDPEAALGALRRALRPGGRLALAVWKALDHQPVFKPMLEAGAEEVGSRLEDIALPFSLGERRELRAMLSDAGFRDVDVAEATREVRFPDPDRFVRLTILSAAAVVPELQALDGDGRERVVERVRTAIAPTVQRYTEADQIAFPMQALIATGRR